MNVQVTDVVAALQARGIRDVDTSELARALYSTDASIYRVRPQVVVRPEHVDELAAVLAVARETGTPLTMRGAGTSIAGNAVGPGIVVDTYRHLNRVLAVDPEARTARVQPGTVHAVLQREAMVHGLRFGPDPSTHTRCSIGGMIGNNACGSRALGYGRTADNVVSLEALTASGAPAASVAPALAELVDAHLGHVRTTFGTFIRQVSGYSFEHLLPENGRSLDRFLVGSEGTLAVVTEATVRLVEDAPVRVLAVLGYPSMADAADAVPALLAQQPVACEGMDERITAVVGTTPDLPRGSGWLLVELTGGTLAEAEARAAGVVAVAGALDARVLTDVVEQLAIWRIREDGAGLASRATRPPGQAGWEDAAVPPDRLGDYLRSFDALLVEHGYRGVPYGHFGDGCVHVRIDFDLESGQGRAGYRRFVEEAARLAASYGGSLSGEHGDGRARSELLPTMYDETSLALMAQAKRLFDPDDLLNPGVLVDPAPLDADIRLAGVPKERPRTFLRLHADGGDLVEAVHRCTGVGKCLADNTGPGGVMCPSFQATRQEKDSTRGRARVLQEAVTGRLEGGWDSEALEDALDLCLACKGCARDCPTGVDMATYKAEWLHQKYDGKRRPRTHYSLGRLPALIAKVPPRLANAGGRFAPGWGKALAGVDPRRGVPRFADRPYSARPAHRPEQADVVLWVDTFTNRFSPQVADAAAKVLEAAGQRVQAVAFGDECCGLTWISTGQLEEGRERLTRLLDRVAATAVPDVPIVALEPSCLAVLRVDSAELLPDGSPPVAQRLVTLAEHLGTLGWQPPSLEGVDVVAQPHCHHASVLGWAADEALLRRAGASLTRVGGCCGLAGNFGMEKGHYEVSKAVFEHALGPAVRSAPDGAVVLADGFSCRTQLEDLAGQGSKHLAELLADRL
ncbi:FAD-binding and (Fe-S)-binding domain-containing protein [Nocardioides caldifontis]|uniref:FAD-binding and (Fe-S)-binding domain-containing protein n=1 Tax=Nocardioides caldifontis TaxID=2588938 RepID=UPI0011DFA255|nr:FAD-binding and (Fe-S)-binding domain-containing protein [Nocardioides caldifontis]